jgi:hypothetical protein
MTFYDDFVKMCKDFGPNFGDERTGCFITTAPSHTSFFTKEFLIRNNKSIVPHRPYMSLFSHLKIKLEGRHVDTIEVMEAESQAGLNTLQNKTSRERLMNGRSSSNGAYAQKWTTSKAIVARAQSYFLTRWQHQSQKL